MEMALQRMYSQSIGYDPKPIHSKYITKLNNDILNTFQDDEYVTDEEHDELAELNTKTNPSYIPSSQENMRVSMRASILDKDGLLIQGRQMGVDVIKELKEICIDHDTASESHVDHLMIELNGYKFSQNATFSDVVIAVIHAMFTRLENSFHDVMTPVNLLSLFSGELQSWGQPVLQKLCYSLEEEKSIIYTLEQIATDENGSTSKSVLWKEPTFRLLLQKMHDLEVLSDECILEWAGERRKSDDDSLDEEEQLICGLFRQKTTQDFLSWLEEESDSDDDSEEDDSEDSDD